MDTLIQVSIVVIAVSFVILIIAFIQTMKVLKAALNEIRLTIGQLRSDVSQITVDMKEAIHHTNAMTLDVRTKLSSLDIVFTAVNDIGQTVHSITGPVKEIASSLIPSSNRDKQPRVKRSIAKTSIDSNKLASAIVDGVMSSMRIWKKMKRT